MIRYKRARRNALAAPMALNQLVALMALTAVVADWPSTARGAEAAFARSACVRVERTVEIGASLGEVWVAITSGAEFCTLAGFTLEPNADPRAPRMFQRVGDVLRARVGDDIGTLICTEFISGKELRVCWEPQNGSYLCHKWLRLRPTPTGTRLIYVDRYTDDQAGSVDATAKRVAADRDKALAAFKSRIEAR